MSLRPTWGWLAIPICLFLFIACGPSAAPIQPLPTPIADPTLAPTATLPPTAAPTAAEAEDGAEVQADDAAVDEVVVDEDAFADLKTQEDALDRFLGDPNAPVVLVEYSDFQCPFCQRHHAQTIPLLVEEYVNSGRLRYEFRDFPIPSLHPLAHRLHEATRCADEAGGNDAFWQAHDLFFDDVPRFQIDTEAAMDTEIVAAFSEVGLPDVSDCLLSNRFADAVQADFTAGQALGVSGTPAFFIDGFQISGAQPFEVFAQAIEAAENGTLAELMQPTAVPPAPPSQVVVPTPASPEIRGETALGDPNAPVQIVEFSDYQCPFCRRHALQTMPLLKELIDSGDVYYVFRDFPIASLHPLAFKLHEAAQCVEQSAGNDAFWLVHDLFFAQADTFNQNAPDMMDAEIAKRLGAIDLWSDEIERCYFDGDMADVVRAGVAEAGQLGLNGTPSFFIQGYPIVGAQPFEVFELAVGMAKEGTLADAFRQQAERQAAQQAAQQQPPQQPNNGAPVDVPLAGNEPSKGSADAPVTIIEYSSYQCPFCKRHFDQTMPSIQPLIDDGTVRYIFKDFPLSSQPQAFKVHEAAHCVHEQGDDDWYWAMHDVMFTNQAVWAGTAMGPHIDVIKEFAHAIEGVDSAEFDDCLDSDRYAEQVQANLEEGVSLNVRGTPSFFINGQFLSGAQPFEVFQQAIDQALQGR